MVGLRKVRMWIIVCIILRMGKEVKGSGSEFYRRAMAVVYTLERFIKRLGRRTFIIIYIDVGISMILMLILGSA